MIWIIFILIWLCSCVIFIAWTYYEDKDIIYTIGDLIDEIKLFMLFPFVNTITLILLGISLMMDGINNLLKLSVLWQKFRNIKLK
jgi:hypothetical protein